MPSGKAYPDAGDPAPRSRARTSGRPAVTAALTEALRPVVEAAGYDLEGITVTPAGRRSVVRIVVDSDSGVDLDAIADVSRAVSDALDDDSTSGLIDGAYQLEVTSPGVERPLVEPRHWRRSIDRLISVDVRGEHLTGRVLSADTEGVTLSIDDVVRAFGWSELGPGRVQVEFNRDGGGEHRAAAQTGEG